MFTYLLAPCHQPGIEPQEHLLLVKAEGTDMRLGGWVSVCGWGGGVKRGAGQDQHTESIVEVRAGQCNANAADTCNTAGGSGVESTDDEAGSDQVCCQDDCSARG